MGAKPNALQINFVRTAINKVGEYQEKLFVPLCINGKFITCLRDTGSSVSIIDQSLVQGSPSVRAEDQILVECAFGIKRYLATCVVEISSPQFGSDKVFKLRVGVVSNLQVNKLCCWTMICM